MDPQCHIPCGTVRPSVVGAFPIVHDFDGITVKRAGVNAFGVDDRHSQGLWVGLVVREAFRLWRKGTQLLVVRKMEGLDHLR